MSDTGAHRSTQRANIPEAIARSLAAYEQIRVAEERLTQAFTQDGATEGEPS